MNNIFGTLSMDALPAGYGEDDEERSDELGAVTHHQQPSSTDEYGGFFDAKIFGGAGWGEHAVGTVHKGQVWTGTAWVSEVSAEGVAAKDLAASPLGQAAATGQFAAPAAPAAPAGNGKYPDLKPGQWVMAQGNAARIIRDTWVYAQWPDNSVTVLENEKGEALNTQYDKDSTAAKNLLLTYGPFQTPKTQPTSAPAAQAAAPTSQRGVGLGNFVAALLPAVMQIWGPKEVPAAPPPSESGSSGTIIAVGIGALVLIGGAALLMRGRGSRSED